ncbi:MAG: aldose epimerase family protein [Bacteroidales bacterium]|jgi:aldose 1-epimerase|nr:galactose mutarotase [Bacteroidales bacterium]MDD3130888.1 galactose mutarotase [Bacteroidales bacterium]MDD4175572.1 galactose mutarotase [Bacteroidales bacterium]
MIKKLLMLVLPVMLLSCGGNQKQQIAQNVMELKKERFGEVDGQQVFAYTITNQNKLTVKLITYGGIITHLWVPDAKGELADVVAGYDSLQQYAAGTHYFGALVGRFANRIARGTFTLQGKMYQLARNNDANHLHGGNEGFDKKVWQAEDFIFADSAGVVLTLTSPDGDEGYPGNLQLKITYTLTNCNELKIDYSATTDAPTILNLTHHSYFNLDGHNSGAILDHKLQINGEAYLPVSQTLIPTGEIKPVEGSPMDFRQPHVIGERIAEVAGGYDHTWVLKNKHDSTLQLAARLWAPTSGRLLEVYTDQPGIQFYAGNMLENEKGKQGALYNQHDALCLETQHFPDSPNHPDFPSVVLRPGEKFVSQTVYKFLNREDLEK